MTYNNYLFKILQDIIDEKEYLLTGFSQNYIIKIFNKKLNKAIYIYGNRFPLNNASSQKICADKSALSQILTHSKIPNILHTLYKNPKFKTNISFKKLKTELLKNPNGIVVKDNNGSCGKNVFLVKKFFSLKRKIKHIFKQGLDVAISPYINYQNEYRLIMLDNTCKACYKKIRPYVIGNGKNTIKQLAKQKYLSLDFKLPIFSNIKKPKVNEKITIGWKHNLANNSIPENITDKKLKLQLITIAKAVTETLGIRFCSVDLIEENGSFKVLEVNSIVSMNKYASFNLENYNTTKQIFKDALQLSFKQ